MSPLPRGALAGLFGVLPPITLASCSDGGSATEPDPPAATATIAIALSTTSFNLAQGENGSVTVTVTCGGGYTGAVQLSLEAVPAGLTGTFDPGSVPAGGTSSTLRLEATANVAAGQYGLTVRARGQGVADATRALTLRVEALSTGEEWAFFRQTSSELPHDWVTTIAVGEGGVRWVGTRNGLAIIEGENWTVYTRANSDLSGSYIFEVAPYGGGRAWVETGVVHEAHCCVGNGIARFDGATWTPFRRGDSGLLNGASMGTVVDDAAGVWRLSPPGIGGFSGSGLEFFDGQTWTRYELPVIDHRITRDPNGSLWLLGLESGSWVLLRRDGESWQVQEAPSAGLTDGLTALRDLFSPGSTAVSGMSVDGHGSIWLGTAGAGILRFDGSSWTSFHADNSGLPSNHVWSIDLDEDGGAWIGMAGGLAAFDGETWVAYDMENSDLPSNFVTAVAIDGNGNKWIGTGPGFARGLAVFNENGIAW